MDVSHRPSPVLFKDQPAFIAEVSSNHHADLDRSLRFVETAKQVGCEGVKFQLFRVDDLFAPEILSRSPLHQKRRSWELPPSFLGELADACRASDIRFGCTPFSLEAVAALVDEVDFLKIASYELLWDDLLIECAGTRKPLILSTGMADLNEVHHAVETIRRHSDSELVLLHCVSTYPAPAAECNLAAIQTLRSAFDCRVGWSDHSFSAAVLDRAVHRWRADVIEFHLDLDGEGAEFAAGHCWLPAQIESTIASIRQARSADGTGVKEPAPSEVEEARWRADPSDGLRPLLAVRRNWRPPS